MNVLFVIDGTQSMQPYIGSVSKAINNSIDKAADMHSSCLFLYKSKNINIKTGLILFDF